MADWFLLPGMGATSQMYNSLRHKLSFPVRFISWPEYRGEKTYEEVARRIIAEHQIKDGDIVGGSSLGGMIALEIARIVTPRGVVLIGSAMKRQEVQNLLSLLSSLVTITPVSLIQTLVGKRKDLVSEMFSEADADFMRAMCSYVKSWQGYDGPADSIFRLHGKRDHVIPCPAKGCDIIDDAGHVVAMTHVAETATFLEKVRTELAES